MSSFPRALSLRIAGDTRAGDIGAVLGSRPVMRLAIANNRMMRGCKGLGQLVGLRALYIEGCGRLRDAAALFADRPAHTARYILPTQGGVAGTESRTDDAADVAKSLVQ
jgi:hypothetical protein